jgi:hypothetical protein
MHASRVVLQFRDSLRELALSNRVRLVWVPGNCGIQCKEETDALEKAGSSSAFVRLHNIDLSDEPICIACGMEDESAFHLLCKCPSLISLRMRTFLKPILSGCTAVIRAGK